MKLATSLILSKGKPTGFQHIARDVTEEKRVQDNMIFYTRQVTRAQEEERKRIARELHDDTAQALVVLSRQLDNFISGSIGKLAKSDLDSLDTLREEVDRTLEGVRRFSQDLRPSILDDLGLLAALEWLADDLSKQGDMVSELKVMGDYQRLLPEMELVLFRLAQEALSNVRRHSQATRAEILVEFNSSEVKLTINDNGQGFELPERMGDLASSGKLGLAGMQERARLLGGVLTVRSEPGKGTRVVVEAPLEIAATK